jgi:hypothetical protein
MQDTFLVSGNKKGIDETFRVYYQVYPEKQFGFCNFVSF